MDTDLFLVIGLFLGVLTIPSMLSAFTEGRAPRAASIILLISGVLIATALIQKPTGYTFAEIPNVVVKVIARYLN